MNNVLVVGGGGFIWVNLAIHLKSKEINTVALDDLSRYGSEINKQLIEKEGIDFIEGDITNKQFIEELFTNYNFSSIVNLAGQVAMTTSIEDPTYDLSVNLFGTHNILEGIRKLSPETSIIYTSTNKVYGDLEWDEYIEKDTRYESSNFPKGYDESLSQNFSGPYGCSKGAAEQYVLDYYKTFSLDTTVLRLSTIYGPHQYSNFNQGWIGWFIGEILKQKENKEIKIEIAGDGKQVRDILHVNDLSSLITKLILKEGSGETGGQPFNVGGGIENALSILELIEYLKVLLDIEQEINIVNNPWRPADQKYYVSNNDKIYKFTDWSVVTGKENGIKNYTEWIVNNEA